MKVMGHRGVAGLALENTLDSFKMAKILGLSLVELDVHLTADNKLVVIHDSNLNRVSGHNISIKNNTYSEIKKIKLIDKKSYVPTIEEVINITKGIHLVIELKSDGCVNKVNDLVKKYPDRKFTIVSFKHSELKKLKKINPTIKIFASERTKPFEIIQFAKNHKLDGIFLNYWLLNPLTYFVARRVKLEIYVYTVNNGFIGRMINLLYPSVTICTDFPEKFEKNNTPPKARS